jgi:hypothetical protein
MLTLWLGTSGAELFAGFRLAFWASMGFKPDNFITAGMNEKRAAWFSPRSGPSYFSVARALHIRSVSPHPQRF